MTAPTACPKCRRERRPGEDACARCGLLVARWAGFSAGEPAPLAHPLLDALWKKVEESWDDEAAHARFLDAAVEERALDLAAARYRAAQDRSPDDARAHAGLERAGLLATQIQMQAEPVLGPSARWLKLVGLAAAALLLMATMWVLFLSLRPR